MLRFRQSEKKLLQILHTHITLHNFFLIKYRNSNLGQQVNEPNKHPSYTYIIFIFLASNFCLFLFQSITHASQTFI